ncbi:MAG TPA: hypothetical protein VGD23_11715 [Sphingomicrobium sp.]
MATVAAPIGSDERRRDLLSGTPRAHAVDRWIYVFTAASFIAIVLAGFIPSSLGKIAAVQAGERGPFPLVLHLHAVLMGSFLLLLLAQTVMMATGREANHRRLGLLAAVLVPALVIVGLVLVPTTYHGIWGAAQAAPPEVQAQLQGLLSFLDNIMLLQLRIGILFPLFLIIALRARNKDAGLHKRMMILATAIAIPAGIDRIPWLPSSIPESPLSADLYMLLAISPMFLWDVIRNRYVHKAYWLWLGLFLPFAIVVHGLWDTPWWHAAARQLMGV